MKEIVNLSVLISIFDSSLKVLRSHGKQVVVVAIFLNDHRLNRFNGEP